MSNIDDYKLNLDQENNSFTIEEATFVDEKRSGFFNKLSSALINNLKVAIPLILILVTVLLVTFFYIMQPEAAPRRPNLTPPLTVSVYDIQSQDFQVNVQSYGTIAPRTQSFLIAQVSGLVTEVSENLREGGFFNKDDVLLGIDQRDYLADLKISEANLAEAKQALSEELAASKQAEEDWRRLGNTEEPSDLVLRKPQQQAALARLASAEAALSKAQLGVDRTQVIAPFDGRVLNKMIDVGQVTANNSQIAEVYATDYVEIRLPLRDSDLKFVDLPEAYRGTDQAPEATPVNIYSSLSDSTTPWLGKVVRTESAIDVDARQLHVVAQIDDPFGAPAVGRTPLKIGEYVTAEIQGKIIPDAIVIPSAAIYQDTYVYVAEDGILVRRNIEVLWQDTSNALIGAGLSNGERLVTTTLGQVASGTRVAIEGEASPQQRNGNFGMGMGGNANNQRPLQGNNRPAARQTPPTQPENNTN